MQMGKVSRDCATEWRGYQKGPVKYHSHVFRGMCAQLGKVTYLCNTNNNEGRSYCHVKYQNEYHCKKYLDAQKALKEKDRNANNVL